MLKAKEDLIIIIILFCTYIMLSESYTGDSDILNQTIYFILENFLDISKVIINLYKQSL